jgi:hypothetical protein
MQKRLTARGLFGENSGNNSDSGESRASSGQQTFPKEKPEDCKRLAARHCQIKPACCAGEKIERIIRRH